MAAARRIQRSREEVATVRARSRRSRFIARVTLFAAMATIATSLAAPSGALAAGRTHAVTLGLGHAASRVGSTEPRSSSAGAGKRPASEPRVAKTLASVPQTFASSAGRASVTAALLVAGLGAGGLLGKWLLEFVGKSSRTRGQPRMGALAA